MLHSHYFYFIPEMESQVEETLFEYTFNYYKFAHEIRDLVIIATLNSKSLHHKTKKCPKIKVLHQY